jgi:hypothetical protein
MTAKARFACLRAGHGRFLSLALGFWFGLLLAPRTAVPAELQHTLGEKGLMSLAFNEWQFLKAPEHGEFLCTAKLRKKDGTEYDGGKLLSIEASAAKDEVEMTFPWGRVSCQFRAKNNRLLALLTVTNGSADDLLDCEVRIGRLTFPEPPHGTQVDGGWTGNGCGPSVPIYGMYGCPEVATPIVRLDFRTAVLDFCSDDPGAPTAVLVKSPEDYKGKNRYSIAVQVVRERYNPLPAGKAAGAAVSLRFSKPGEPWTATAADVFGKYYAVYPFRNAWQDSRMMTSFSAHTAINNRLLKEIGVEACRQRMNQTADNMIKVMREYNVSTMIDWEPTGAQDHEAPIYTGSPEAVEKILPPEGVAVVDEWFKRFRDAGLNVGCCLRPQELLPVHGRWYHHVPDDPAKLLVRRIRWAQERWGCTVFHVDSFGNSHDPFGSNKYTQNHFTHALDTDYLQQAAEACPDVLICPEQKTSRCFAYGSPYNVTARPVRDQYPGAFSLNAGAWHFDTKAIKHGEKFDLAKLDAAAFAKVVQWARSGDALLLPAAYPANSFLVGVEAYKQAGTLPSAKLTAPVRNTTCLAGKELTVAADASDADGKVQKVEFFCSTVAEGTIKIGESPQAPYTCRWRPPTAGRYVLSIRATDNDGLTRDPAAAVVWANAQPGPQMQVFGRVREIQDGASMARLSDGTDFGAPWEGIGVERAFSIENTGTETLKLAALPRIEGSSEFTLAAPPDLIIAPGKRTEFSIRFAAVGTGIRTAKISIAQAAGGRPFTFQVRGTGKPSSARRINCGGPSFGEYNEDCGYQGGWQDAHSSVLRVPGNFDPGKVDNPPPKDVYATARYADCIYTITGFTAGKEYRVRLHFSEPAKWFNRPNPRAAAGKRKFDVGINGRRVLTDLDVFAEVGAAEKALVKEFTTTAGGKGDIAIEFFGNDALINAIETLDAR